MLRLIKLLLVVAVCVSANASRLPTSSVTANGSDVGTTFTDSSLSTYLVCSNAHPIVIDLGSVMQVHGVYLTGTNTAFQLWGSSESNPLGLFNVFVGETLGSTGVVAQFTIPPRCAAPIDTEASIRFSPTAGRYVVIRLQTDVTWGASFWPGYAVSQPTMTNHDWRIAELEVHGTSNSWTNENAVVIPSGAAQPLQIAALDLSYYLGELSGKPHPIIATASTGGYSGTLYHIADLASLATNYSQMVSNVANGSLPYGSHVSQSGSNVTFTGFPYRCVLWSVWDFLDRQGVRWTLPTEHGDYIPVGAGVSLSMLPIAYTPTATNIYANFSSDVFSPWSTDQLQGIRQSALWVWRNKWSSSWNWYGFMGGGEVPLNSHGTVEPDYTELFSGYPHNLNTVLPARVLTNYADWWGYSSSSGVRVNPTNASAPSFCFGNPDAIEWLAAKMTNVATVYPNSAIRAYSAAHHFYSYNILPQDSSAFCECTNYCTNLYGFESGHLQWSYGLTNSFSSPYFNMINEVAKLVDPSTLVGGLAYADYWYPPSILTDLETNVVVEVASYGAPNLSMTGRWNAPVKSVWDQWASKAHMLTTYDYALLHTDYYQTNSAMPVPLVYGILNRAHYLASIGALNGGCQAEPTSIPFNPWNFYAYPRVRWNTNQTAQGILSDFFEAHFAEAADDMLEYYTAMEDYQVTNDANAHLQGYAYGPTPNLFPISVLAEMESSLERAEAAATNWTTAVRVANARAGFDFLIERYNLTGVDLSDESTYDEPVPGTTYDFDLSTLTTQTNPPNFNFATYNGSVWEMYAQGWIQKKLNMPLSGRYRLTVSAKGVASAGVYPTMNVYLGTYPQSLPVSSADYSDYVFTNSVSAMVQDVVITYENPALAGARQLFIDGIELDYLDAVSLPRGVGDVN
jgi:hypothetical protein